MLARFFFARARTTQRTSIQEARLAAWLAPTALEHVAARRQPRAAPRANVLPIFRS